MTPALVLALLAPPAPICAERGASTMDPRLEHATGISTRIKVREPARPVLVATRRP